MDFILVCSICSIHRSGSADDQQQDQEGSILPPPHFTYWRSGFCDIRMASACACDRFIFPSCGYSSGSDHHRSFCFCRDKRDRTFLPGVHSPRRSDNDRCQHIFNGDRRIIWCIFCLQALEDLSSVVFSRDGRACGEHTDIPHDCIPACPLPESGERCSLLETVLARVHPDPAAACACRVRVHRVRNKIHIRNKA